MTGTRRKKNQDFRTRTRQILLHRDHFRCFYCQTSLTNETMTMDHVVPVSQNGFDDLRNLVSSCFPCNRDKADQILPNTPEILQEIALRNLKTVKICSQTLTSKRYVKHITNSLKSKSLYIDPHIGASCIPDEEAV